MLDDIDTKEIDNALRYVMRGYDGPRDLTNQIALAKCLSESDMYDDRYLRKPANIVRMMWKAMALDIPLDSAMEQVGIFKGKTTVANAMILALMRRGGIKVGIPQRNEEGTILRITRPGEEPVDVSFMMKDAKAANLTDDKKTHSGNIIPSQYKLRPTTMLFWRAVAEAGRTMSSDITNGLSLYTREELEAIPDYDENASTIDADTASSDIEAVLTHAKEARKQCDKSQWDDAWRKAAGTGILDMPSSPGDKDSPLVQDVLKDIGREIVAVQQSKQYNFDDLGSHSTREQWVACIDACQSIEEVSAVKNYMKVHNIPAKFYDDQFTQRRTELGGQDTPLSQGGIVAALKGYENLTKNSTADDWQLAIDQCSSEDELKEIALHANACGRLQSVTGWIEVRGKELKAPGITVTG